MRIVLGNQEFFVFKDKVFGKSTYYYNNAQSTLADKYFTKNLGRIPASSVEILELLESSTKIESLLNPPSVVNVSYIAQMDEIQTFLSDHFDIKIDGDFNFYAWTTRRSIDKNKRSFFKHYYKKIKIYFSWDQVLGLYNDCSGLGVYDFNCNQTIDDETKTEYLKKKRRSMKDSTKNLKKYAYLTLKKSRNTKNRKNKRGFFIDGEALVSLPN